MKRDMDLVREILLKIEKHEHGMAPDNLSINGYTEEQVGYHVHLMGQAGLLKVADMTCRGSTSPAAMPIRMEWNGHEFLDAIRSDTIWDRTKKTFIESGVTMTIDLVKAVAIAKGKELLGLT